MKREALHHVTMITGDAQRNVGFYADLLGLRMVKKTVNFDRPEGAGTVHHIAWASRDEDPERLGEELRVPKMHAHRRDELERKLTPVINPRTTRRQEATA